MVQKLDPIGRTQAEVDQEYAEIEAALAGGSQQQPRRSPTASRPQASGNLSGGLNALGLDVSTTSGGYVDSEDLPVYIGTSDSKGRKRRSNPVVNSSHAYLAPYRWKNEDLGAFQRRMFNAGMLGDDENAVAWGTVDGLTERAWRGLVDTAANYYAAGKKIRPQDVLDQIGTVGVGGTGRERAPLTVQLSNPETVKSLMREAARDALGSGKLDDARMDEIVARWQGKEREAQTSAYNLAETGGTVTEPPKFEAFADTELQRIDPVAYDAYKMLDAFRVVMDLLGGEAA